MGDLSGEVEVLRLALQDATIALEYYASPNTWDHKRMMVMSEAGRDDLEETPESRFLPGLRARKALAKVNDWLRT